MAEMELRNVKRSLKSQEKNLKKEMRRAQKDMERAVGFKGRRAVRFKTLSGEELEEFYQIAPSIVAALSDTRRLKLLKGLEKRPMYQGDLSDTVDIKGPITEIIQNPVITKIRTNCRSVFPGSTNVRFGGGCRECIFLPSIHFTSFVEVQVWSDYGTEVSSESPQLLSFVPSSSSPSLFTSSSSFSLSSPLPSSRLHPLFTRRSIWNLVYSPSSLSTHSSP